MQQTIQLNEYQANVIGTVARLFSITPSEVLQRAVNDEIEHIEDVLVKNGHIKWAD